MSPLCFDVAVVGGGPAGLAFAAALGGTGLAVAVIERQPEAALRQPGFDGREIAVTHHSQAVLRRLGAWARIPAEAPSPLREARVLDGASPYALRFDTSGRPEDALGSLVSNHLLRRALFETAAEAPGVALLAGAAVQRLGTDVDGARLHLADGREVRAALLVAADSRDSPCRTMLGIGAERRDLGRQMLVCRLRHALPHGHVATEWFDYGQTLAMLPLNGPYCSAVVTLPPDGIDALMALPEAEVGPAIARRYRHRLGEMELVSSRHRYPLASSYAERFCGTRAALIGDAAVGMLPITAHGFNFGLRGADTLARGLREAVSRGRDFGAPDVLRRYHLAHRAATRPLFLATLATALLFDSDAPPARLLRGAALRLGNTLGPVRRALVSRLMESEPG